MSFDAIKHPQKRAFLAAYALTGSIKFASRYSKVKRESHYDWKSNDAAYAHAFRLAEQMAGDVLVDEAKRRAHKGVSEYVLYKGEVVVYDGKPLRRTKFSDALLQFLIENLKPEFVEKREIRHSTPEAIKVELTQRMDLSGLSEEELQELERIASKLTEPGRGGEVRTPAPNGKED